MRSVPHTPLSHFALPNRAACFAMRAAAICWRPLCFDSKVDTRCSIRLSVSATARGTSGTTDAAGGKEKSVYTLLSKQSGREQKAATLIAAHGGRFGRANGDM